MYQFAMNTMVVFIASFLGGLIQTVSGFGCGIIIMLFLPYIMPVVQASGLSVLITILLNIMLVIKYRKSINMKLVLAPAGISFIISTICVYISVNMNLNAMKLLFGAFLIVLALYFIFFSERIALTANKATVLVCASLAGAANGLFGIGGPPMALYFLMITKEKEEYIGTTQMYFLLTSIYTTLVRAFNGVFNKQILLLSVPGIIAIILGGFAGGYIVHKISREKMNKVIYIFLVFSGVITLIQSV